MGIILTILSFAITRFILSPLKKFIINAGAVRKNYLGNQIPIGLGLVLMFGTIPSFFIYSLFTKDENIYFLFLILTITILVGFIDDILGDHSVKGLKGHIFILLKKRELTSGALKAIIISLISIFIGLYYWENLILFALNFVILILTTNMFNLFDVRPGRVIKIYLLIFMMLFIPFPPTRTYLSIIFASVLAYAPLDFKGKGMLGDTGSNFLGMSIGLSLVLNLSYFSKAIVFILLVILHIYTEKKSLTELIEKIRILRLIDNMGR